MNTIHTNTRISVIIPTYKRGNIFYECLASVINSITDLDEIIVVNDDKQAIISLDGIDIKNQKITILNNPKKGVASARNMGAAHAQGDVVLFVDDDMIINQESVNNAFNYLQKNISSIVNANWVYQEKDIERLQNTSFGRYLIKIGFHSLEGWNYGVKWTENSFISVQRITSQFMMMNKVTFETIGGYDEAFPFAGFEDAAFCTAIENKNINCVIDTTSLVFHNEIDRMQVLPFLERKKRGAFTRKIGLELGYDSFKIHYSLSKKSYYFILTNFKPVILILINNTPNKQKWDSIYGWLMNRLLGIYIYEGYFKKKISTSY